MLIFRGVFPSCYISCFKRLSEGRQNHLVSSLLCIEFPTSKLKNQISNRLYLEKKGGKKHTPRLPPQHTRIPPNHKSPSDIPPVPFPRKILPSFPPPSQHPAVTRRPSRRPRWPSPPRHRRRPGPWTTLRRHRPPLRATDGIGLWFFGNLRGGFDTAFVYIFLYIFILCYMYIYIYYICLCVWSWRSVVGVFHDILIYFDGNCALFAG